MPRLKTLALGLVARLAAQLNQAQTASPRPTPTTPPDFSVPLPTHGPMAANCKVYWQAGRADTCVEAVAEYPLINQEQFLSWNPSLQGHCNGLWADTWYCAVAFDYDDLPMPATVAAKPTPLPSGTTSQCRSWFRTRGPDTCALIVAMFGTFSEADFISWNPSVRSDCSGIVSDGMYYCVGVPGTPTTRSSALSVPTPTPPPTGTAAPGPTQNGTAADCSRYWLVSAADTCESIAERAGIAQDSLKYSNPALKDDCSGLELDVYVCVERPDSAGGGDGSGPSSVAVTSASGTTLPPMQTGMVQGCRKFYYVQSGDGCWANANANGIELSSFYTWNPAVHSGGKCAGLLPDVFVCVGV
ncbi:uncharacterized protein F5Z01DRAFT_521244 [Emericellopsis atlantica]|uniref:LysM domain-containing protein n=1 Tax=Emericellopsis atlantica TaxID=2614577 RepID=A0A9P7ZPF6_9HYPO|nr:uncharacterized protein F5Z01DRAFT_521244 [Emericellopsis atlantica]KAG9255874.1 hypothetical protein F5Z01DRAFT_521244 [Emericellopsis atlantica]